MLINTKMLIGWENGW